MNTDTVEITIMREGKKWAIAYNSAQAPNVGVWRPDGLLVPLSLPTVITGMNDLIAAAIKLAEEHEV